MSWTKQYKPTKKAGCTLQVGEGLLSSRIREVAKITRIWMVVNLVRGEAGTEIITIDSRIAIAIWVLQLLCIPWTRIKWVGSLKQTKPLVEIKTEIVTSKQPTRSKDCSTLIMMTQWLEDPQWLLWEIIQANTRIWCEGTHRVRRSKVLWVELTIWVPLHSSKIKQIDNLSTMMIYFDVIS